MTEANKKDYRVGNDGFWARAWVTPLVLAVVGGLALVVIPGTAMTRMTAWFVALPTGVMRLWLALALLSGGGCGPSTELTGTPIPNSLPDTRVTARPPDVLEAADYVGSTAQMTEFVQAKRPARVLMVTECSMSDNVAADVPDVEFIRPCNLCPHMKRISLAKIYESLEKLAPRVEIDPRVADKARRAVERMLEHG